MKTTKKKSTATPPAPETVKKVEWTPGTVGRTYQLTRYAVLSRKVGGDGKWYGHTSYLTLKDAQEAMKAALTFGRYQTVAGITVDFGPDNGDRYERKLVRVDKHCVVLAVGVGPV